MDFNVVLDTTNPPTQTISALPLERTWWTVKAYDPFGSSIYADPRLIRLPENRPPVANAGLDQVLYAGLNGKATVTLDGSKSTDPDGDTLAYTWAWVADGKACLSNAMSLSLDLPAGVHTIQLMVNDGHVNSEPSAVTVTVVAPFECDVKVAPSAINLRSNGPHILACVRFPAGLTTTQVESDSPLLIYPGGIAAMRRWTEIGDAGQVSVFAFFNRDALADLLQPGPADLMVVGKLRSGQMFYGSDTVKVIGNDKKK